MSGASDKARFYQERFVPELQELERKQIFTKQEISSIARKRSDFEHKLNARGSRPSDYVRYVEYEMNLETLRRKRVKRLGVKSTKFVGQRRIFSVLDRATKKFHGDVGLWMQYITYARQQKSHKKVAEILTQALRLHPTNPELWIYAARCSSDEQSDISEARSHMQRGLRFCERSPRMWLEYGRLELIFIAKLEGRRQVLGLTQADEVREGHVKLQETPMDDVIVLPTISAGEFGAVPSLEKEDQTVLEKIEASPILSGAVPMTVYNEAMKHLYGSDTFSLDFYDMVAEYVDLACQPTILNCILDTVRSQGPQTAAIMIRWIRQPIIGIELVSATFPSALEIALSRIKTAMTDLEDVVAKTELCRRLVEWFLSLLAMKDIDQGLETILELTLRKVWSQYMINTGYRYGDQASQVETLLEGPSGVLLRQIVQSTPSQA